MILRALVDCYEALAAKGEVPRPGWGRVRVQYSLEIDGDGKLHSILPLESVDANGKALPRWMDLPSPVKRTSGIASNFLWDNAAYLLALDGKGSPKRTMDCFAAAKELHLTLLAGVDEPFAHAICAFFNNWTPDGANQDVLEPYRQELEAGANLTFLFRAQFPPGNDALARAWQRHYDQSGEQTSVRMRCLVTGEQAAPELTHPAIKKVRNAQSSGAALVSFNAPAFCSYGQSQNLNAPVSKYAAFAYTTALNHLLADSTHVKYIGDTTVVYWAEQAQTQYQDVFGGWLGGETMTEHDLDAIMEAMVEGRPVLLDGLTLDPENHFCVLGLAPNAARLSIRFFLHDTFGGFAKNMQEHDRRLQIVRPQYDKDAHLPLWKLLRETVNPNAKDKTASPQMAGDMLRAILTGGRYPATLYQRTQLRIKAQSNITRAKAAIIKAYLLRNLDDECNKEALTVELNEDTVYLPYILGRMFSVLEAIQQKANPNINTTIKDKYFTSACATPAVVFPMLVNLAQKHMRKLDEKDRIWLARQLGELTDRITQSYPAHLTLSDQGIFQLGYYHETQKRYMSKEKKEDK